MNRYNPEGKDIRFIDSHYNDLFRIPDGGHIQIDYGNETVVKPCTFIDEYHTQVGNNVFHICQFAEVMERNGNHYQAEPPIMGDEAAWQVGKDNYLAIQTCDDGYDYTLFDKDFKEIDGGQLDNPEMSMIEVRNEILSDFNMAHRDLRAAVYEEIMEMSESVALPTLCWFWQVSWTALLRTMTPMITEIRSITAWMLLKASAKTLLPATRLPTVSFWTL